MTFSIRHIVSRVRGTFRQWEGSITIPDPVNWDRGSSIDVTIQTASIFTDNERRDAHLRTSDFFLADSFPTITFRSTRIERSGDEAKIHGNLTMRGVTKPVVITGEFLGTQGAEFQRVGFEGTTKLNRLDYGVAWNRALEGGGVTLGRRGDDQPLHRSRTYAGSTVREFQDLCVTGCVSPRPKRQVWNCRKKSE